MGEDKMGEEEKRQKGREEKRTRRGEAMEGEKEERKGSWVSEKQRSLFSAGGCH